MKEFLKQPVWAVVGATDNQEKFGYKIYRTIKEYRKTYPVNPKLSDIEGEKCYPDLKSLPEIPDVVDLVVPPKVTESIVKECKELGIKRVWMQPGTDSPDAIRFCEENGIEVVHHQCAMVEIAGKH
jgi:hypothetical protein